jgi:hypothetical protein
MIVSFDTNILVCATAASPVVKTNRTREVRVLRVAAANPRRIQQCCDW